MKQTVAVLLLLVLLAGGIVWNALYINKVANRLTALADGLPPIGDPACVPAAEALRSEWERAAARADLSVSYTLTDRVGEQAALLASCAASGDAFGYASARSLFKDALRDLSRAEKFFFAALF